MYRTEIHFYMLLEIELIYARFMPQQIMIFIVTNSLNFHSLRSQDITVVFKIMIALCV